MTIISMIMVKSPFLREQYFGSDMELGRVIIRLIPSAKPIVMIIKIPGKPSVKKPIIVIPRHAISIINRCSLLCVLPR